MNDEQKRRVQEAYQRAKEKGVAFFPEVVFKDIVVALAVFLVLIGLAYFLGAPLEEPADPADSSYTPRPEWYFLFLFQLLKYFPGELEVIGVFLLPTLVFAALFLLPLLDRSPQRHIARRPLIAAVTAVGVLAVGLLTALSILEAPPPVQAVAGDPTAALYLTNCAGCHGPSINVPPGTDLHAIIAQGKHDEGMPAWSADLSGDQIDALAGFILSPAGNSLFTETCGACHQVVDLVASDPFELRAAVDAGDDFPAHAEVTLPERLAGLSPVERTAILNFLLAPDGQRLFALECSACHGQAVAFAGGEDELRTIIRQGGRHLEMPSWRGTLSQGELEVLAEYVVDPSGTPQGSQPFTQYCAACHGQAVPAASNVAQARELIARGGAHETMPVWGDLLTDEQIDALVAYTLDAAGGKSLVRGQQLYQQNCATCHGGFGEGGLNPTRAGDVIAPISTREYLSTRDDRTLQAIIARGQPNFGMSPFGTTFGGPLDDDDVGALVAFIRSWEANPPVELPPEIAGTPVSLTGGAVFEEVCAQCHGADGTGLVGPSLAAEEFQAKYSDAQIFDTINFGHGATSMIAWGEVLTADQIEQLVRHIRRLGPTPPTTTGAPSFRRDIAPILEQKCNACHGVLGGWDGRSYRTVVQSGDHGPAVLPGDVENSLLAKKLLGTQTLGAPMPPSGLLPRPEAQLILDWIAAGAPNN